MIVAEAHLEEADRVADQVGPVTQKTPMTVASTLTTLESSLDQCTAEFRIDVRTRRVFQGSSRLTPSPALRATHRWKAWKAQGGASIQTTIPYAGFLKTQVNCRDDLIEKFARFVEQTLLADLASGVVLATDEVAELVDAVYVRQAAGDTDDVVVALLATIDDWLSALAFEKCQTVLDQVDARRVSARILLALLNVTFAARTQLPRRARFFRRVEALLRSERPAAEVDALLRGLE